MGHNASLPENVFYAPIIQRTAPNDRHVEKTKVQQHIANCQDKHRHPKYHKPHHSSRLPNEVDTSGDGKNITMPKKHASNRRDFDPRTLFDEKTHHRCKKVSEKDDEAIFKRTLQQAHANHAREKKNLQVYSAHDPYMVPTRESPYHRHKQVSRGSYVIQHACDGYNVYKYDETKIQKECYSIPLLKKEEQLREEAMMKRMKKKSRKHTVNIEGVEYEKKKSHHQLMKDLLKPEMSTSYTDALVRFSRVESERKKDQNTDAERKKNHLENNVVSQSATEKRCGLRMGLERRKEDGSEKKPAKRGPKSDTVARYASLVELERRRDARETYADMNDAPLVNNSTCPVSTTVQYSSRAERQKPHINEQKNEAPIIKETPSKTPIEIIYRSKAESEKRRDLRSSVDGVNKCSFANTNSSVLEAKYPSKVETERRINIPSRDSDKSLSVTDTDSSVLQVRCPSRVELERRKAASNEESFLKRAVMQSDSVAGYASLVALERRRDTGDCCSDMIVHTIVHKNDRQDHVNKTETNFTYSSERVDRGKDKQQEKESRSDVKLKTSISRNILVEKTKESKVNANVELNESKSSTNLRKSDTQTICNSSEPRSSTVNVTSNEYKRYRKCSPKIVGRPPSKTRNNDSEFNMKVSSSPNSDPNLKSPTNTKSTLWRNEVAFDQGLYNTNPITMTCQVDVKGKRYAPKVVPPSRVWRSSDHSIRTPQVKPTSRESGHQQKDDDGDDDKEDCKPYSDELCSRSVRSKNKMFEILAGKTKPLVQTRTQVPAQEPAVECCHHRLKHQQICNKKRPPPVFTPWDQGMILHSRSCKTVDDPPETLRVCDSKPAPKKEVDEEYQHRPDHKLDPERVTRFEKVFRSTMRWKAVAGCDNKYQQGACTFCGGKRGNKNGCSMCSPPEWKVQKREMVENKIDQVHHDNSRVRRKFPCKPASHFYRPVVEEGQVNVPIKRETRQERVCKGATGREKQCECRGRERKYEPEDSDYEIDAADSASNYDPYFKDSQKALFRNARAGWNERDKKVARQECSRRPRCGRRPMVRCRRIAGSEVSFQSRNRGKTTQKPLKSILKRCGCRCGDHCGGD